MCKIGSLQSVCSDPISMPSLPHERAFVDDIGLDDTKEHPARDAFGNHPPDCCISMGSSPLVSENALRVDDIGLDDIKV